MPFPDDEWNGWRNALKDKVEAKTQTHEVDAPKERVDDEVGSEESKRTRRQE